LQANDSGLASYVAGQIDRTLSWKVCFVLLPPPSSRHRILRDLESGVGVVNVQDVKWLQSITSMPILVKGVVTAEDGKLLLFFSARTVSNHHLTSPRRCT